MEANSRFCTYRQETMGGKKGGANKNSRRQREYRAEDYIDQCPEDGDVDRTSIARRKAQPTVVGDDSPSVSTPFYPSSDLKFSLYQRAVQVDMSHGEAANELLVAQLIVTKTIRCCQSGTIWHSRCRLFRSPPRATSATSSSSFCCMWAAALRFTCMRTSAARP